MTATPSAASDALGLIEVLGLVGMTVAIEAMTTVAAVECVMLRRVSGGYLAAAIRGDVASVQTALDAGRASATRYSAVRDAQVHPNPHPDSLRLLARSPGWLRVEPPAPA